MFSFQGVQFVLIKLCFTDRFAEVVKRVAFKKASLQLKSARNWWLKKEAKD